MDENENQIEIIDYNENFDEINEAIVTLTEVQTETLEHIGEIEAFGLFGVVVVLCFFVYKFFRMFF